MQIKDAALVAAARQVEHYEMSAYGSAWNFAKHAGHQDIADILQQTLDEESLTDNRLTELAEGGINPSATA